VVNIWNKLPADILNAVTVHAFAAKLRSCDLSRYLMLEAVYMCINLFLIFGIDLGVRVPVYTFTCTHFYSLVYIACPMFCVMCKL